MAEKETLIPMTNSGLSIAGTVVFIIGDLAGTGVLMTPRAVENIGIPGFFVFLVFTIVTAYTGILLAEAWLLAVSVYDDCQGHIADPYPLLGQKTYGKFGEYTVSICVNISLMGSTVVFLLLASSIVQMLMDGLGMDVTFCYWLPIFTAIITPLTWFGTPKDFWPVAVTASASTVVASVFMMCMFIQESVSNTDVVTHSHLEPQGFSMALGIFLFVLSGHPAFLTFQMDMRKPTDFKWAAISGFAAVFCLYMTLGMSGYVAYGSRLKTNVLHNFKSGTLLYITVAMFIIHLIMAFIIFFNPVCQMFEKKLNVPKNFTWKRCVSRTFLVGIIFFVAETIPRFGAIMSFLGGNVLMLLSVVFPCLFYMKMCDIKRLAIVEEFEDDNQQMTQFLLEKDTKVYLPFWMKITNYIIITLGVLVGIASSVYAVVSMVRPESFTVPCYINSTAASAAT